MTAQQSFRSILAALFLFVVPLLAHAETKILTAETIYYTMVDGETPSFAEAMALQKAKQMALEQAGTYVESYTKVQTLDLTIEEIQTIAGGVMQTEVLEKKRLLVGDGLQLYVKIKATITTDKMEELAQRIKYDGIGYAFSNENAEYVAVLSDEAIFRVEFRLPAKMAEKLEKIQARVGGSDARPRAARPAMCKVVLGKETE